MRYICDMTPKVRAQRKAAGLKYEIANPERMLWHRAKYRAKKKSLAFSIRVEDINIPELCPVLGIVLRVNKGKGSGYFPDSPSLDRIKPELGYIPSNIRVISCRANLLKCDGTVEEMILVLEDLKRCVT